MGDTEANMPAASGTAVTRFGLGGWGTRRAGSFAGKTTTTAIVGGCWVAGDVYSAGFCEGMTYTPGFVEASVYTAGFHASDVNLPGFVDGDTYLPGFQEGEGAC